MMMMPRASQPIPLLLRLFRLLLLAVGGYCDGTTSLPGRNGRMDGFKYQKAILQPSHCAATIHPSVILWERDTPHDIHDVMDG